jgi:hypothetical protein
MHNSIEEVTTGVRGMANSKGILNSELQLQTTKAFLPLCYGPSEGAAEEK